MSWKEVDSIGAHIDGTLQFGIDITLIAGTPAVGYAPGQGTYSANYTSASFSCSNKGTLAVIVKGSIDSSEGKVHFVAISFGVGGNRVWDSYNCSDFSGVLNDLVFSCLRGGIALSNYPVMPCNDFSIQGGQVSITASTGSYNGGSIAVTGTAVLTLDSSVRI